MLSDQDRLILDFEGSRWKTHTAKVAAIWNNFDMTESHYRRALLRIVDNPDAEAAAPVLVRRLRALRERMLLEPRPLSH